MQLISQMCVNLMVYYWICTPFNIWRMTASPVSGPGFWLLLLASYATVYFIYLSALEYLLIKFLTNVVFKRVLPLMDDFFAAFFLATNICLGLNLGFLELYTEEASKIELRYGGLPVSMSMTTPIQSLIIPMTGIVSITIALVCGSILWIRWRQQSSVSVAIPPEEQDDPNPGINNKEYKVEAVSVSMMVIFIMLSLFAVMFSNQGGLVVKDSNIKEGNQLLITYILVDLT